MPSIVTKFKSVFSSTFPSPRSSSSSSSSPSSPSSLPTTSLSNAFGVEVEAEAGVSLISSTSSTGSTMVHFAEQPRPIIRSQSTPQMNINMSHTGSVPQVPWRSRTTSNVVSTATAAAAFRRLEQRNEKPNAFQRVRIPSIPGYCF